MGVSREDKLFMTKHLSTLIMAGVPLSESLETVRDQASPDLAKVMKKICDDVENGSTLAKAMGKHKRVFDEFFVSLIEAGETAGTLDENLKFLAEQMDKDFSLRRKISGALMYPGLVIGATTVMGILISWFVLPKLVDLFNSFQVELPMTTKVLMWFAALMRDYGTFIVLGFFGTIFGLMALVQMRPVRQVVDRWLIGVPFVGKVVVFGEMGKFSRNLGTLLKSGLPVVQAMEITINTLGNLQFKKDFGEVKKKIAEGKSLYSAMSAKRYRGFSKMSVRMIDVGEKSGNLEEMLIYLSTYYDEEIDNVSKNMSTLLEPALLLFIGVVVAFTALAIISPIYSLMGGIGG